MSGFGRARSGRVTLMVAMLLVAGAVGACSGSEENDPAAGGAMLETGDDGSALLALHAEPDAVEGGRIVDELGREVLLRGVNVNALGDYWQHSEFRPTFPLVAEDGELIAGLGWNVVRLVVSWSQIEPEPGVYDEAYIDEIANAVRLFARHGVYTIVDLHQDAWGATLAARADEACSAGTEPALGWDGAPGWATLDGGAPRCVPANIRELSPAVMAAWDAFWRDATGPGGVGIRTRYVAMLAYVAGRFATETAVAGYDVMNEPYAVGDDQLSALGDFYADAVAAIRSAEDDAQGFSHLVVFEPSITWSDLGTGAPPEFARDDDVVFGPHIYRGALTPGPVQRSDFERARADAATYGGVPVLIGEWGSTPRNGPDDPGFRNHLAFQDEFGFSSTLWTWRESCGDPHRAAAARDGRARFGGLFEVDCDTNQVVGARRELMDQLAHPYVRAAPGRLVETSYDPGTGGYTAAGISAGTDAELVVWHPARPDALGPIATEGLPNGVGTHLAGADGGTLLTGVPSRGAWRITVGPGA